MTRPTEKQLEVLRLAKDGHQLRADPVLRALAIGNCVRAGWLDEDEKLTLEGMRILRENA